MTTTLPNRIIKYFVDTSNPSQSGLYFYEKAGTGGFVRLGSLADASRAGGNTFEIDSSTAENVIYNGLGGADTYVVRSNLDKNIEISDPHTGDDGSGNEVKNTIVFDSDVTVTSINQITRLEEADVLRIELTLDTGAVITVNGPDVFQYVVGGATALDFAGFIATYGASGITPANRAPVIDIASFVSIDENADGSADLVPVGYFFASDADAGDTLTYSIVSAVDQNGGDVTGFEFVGNGGLVAYVGTGFDAEAITSVVLTVSASDGQESVQTSVTISVTNIDEAIESAPPGLSIDENVDGSRTPVALFQVAMTDARDAVITYSIANAVDQNGGNVTGFDIDGSRGIISYAGTGLDAETITSVALTISARNGEDSVEGTYAIAVTNIDEGNARFVVTSDGDITAAAVGDVLTIRTISADPDGNDAFTYQWYRDGAEIADATEASYTIPEDYDGNSIYVVVRYTDGSGADEVVTVSGILAPAPEDNADRDTPATLPATPAVLNLADLTPATGFRLIGDKFGFAVSSVGDINGDGYDDFAIGAYLADQNGEDSGATYVVFGKASGFSRTMDLSELDGSDGFRIDGENARDKSGYSVSSAGDINGDGYNDIIIGAHEADQNGEDSGATYVVFGKASGFSGTIDLSNIVRSGSGGVRIDGEKGYYSGNSVSAGDVNGDGYDDIIIGTDFNGSASGSGSIYVVFGKADGSNGLNGAIELSELDDSDGFRIDGGIYIGWSVSAGDVNGDGYDDVIIGSPFSSPNGDYSGSTYVVFGKDSGFSRTMDLSELDGSDGFRIDGENRRNLSGDSVSAGDINNDGYDDIIIGTPWADLNGDYSGATYVVFGKESGFSRTMDLSELDGSDGFRIDGEGGNDYSGHSVSSAGDFNGDGYDDIIIGAWGAGPNGNDSGSSYVVFGKESGFSRVIELSELDGRDGVRIDGANAGDWSGYSVSSAGDVNGDGYDDIIIGAPGAEDDSYVIYGYATSGIDADEDTDTVIPAPAPTNRTPVFENEPTDLSINENADGSAAPVSVGRVVASDADAGDTLTYSIINTADQNGDSVTGFEVDGTGLITYVGTGLDAETITSVALTVSASDGEDSAQTSVAISVTNIDEGNASFVVASDRDINAAVVGDVLTVGLRSSDPDGDGTFTYQWYRDGAEIADATGASYTIPEDYDGNSIYVVVRYTDGSGTNEVVTLSGIIAPVPEDNADRDTPVNLAEANIIVKYFVDTSNPSQSGFYFYEVAGDDNLVRLDRVHEGTLGGDDTFEIDSPTAENVIYNGLGGADTYVIRGRLDNDVQIHDIDFGDDGSGNEVKNTIVFASDVTVTSIYQDRLQGRADVIKIEQTLDTDAVVTVHVPDAFEYVVGGAAALDFAEFIATYGASGISATNRAPVIQMTLFGGINENVDGSAVPVFVGFVDASDADAHDTLTYSIVNAVDQNGDSVTGFEVDGEGEITYVGTGLDAEAIASVALTVSASDGQESVQTSGAVSVLATPVVLNLADLNPTTGFRFDGEMAYDFSGRAVSSAGDINNDGIDDFAIGAPGADPNGSVSGSTYIIYGKEGGLDANINLGNLLDNSAGFRIDGASRGDNIGYSVSSAGDVNGDTYDDIIIGTPFASPNGFRSGSTYVVFGKNGNFEDNVDLSHPTSGANVRINGESAGYHIGWSVSGVGDVNGDGYDDVIIGAVGADWNGEHSGSTYVVFGGEDGLDEDINPSSIVASNGMDGFRIDGESAGRPGGEIGRSVSLGDINGDGIDDIAIGASSTDSNGNIWAGTTYVVFGKDDNAFAATMNLSELDGSNGFRIDGESGADWSGYSISLAGDFNGDGIDDLIIGAYGADSNGKYHNGASYVVFGNNDDDAFAATMNLSELNGSNGFRINGESTGDNSGKSVSSAGDFNGDGYDDIIIGAPMANSNNGRTSGATYVVFGKEGGFDATVELSDIIASDVRGGFRINGESAGDRSGEYISSAGDVNHDGYDDLIIGKGWVDPNGDRSGTSYIVYGHATDGASDITGGPANRAPVIGSALFFVSIDENIDGSAVPVFVGWFHAFDPDAHDTLTYSIVSAVNQNGDSVTGFDVDGEGEITYVGTGLDAEAIASVALTVSASDGEDSVQTLVAISVTDLNDVAPTITSGATGNALAENATVPNTQVIYTATGTSDVTDISWSLSGPDAGLFNINSATGEVRFETETTPDHEGKDNYSFTVVATSGALSSVTQDVTIEVTNIDEGNASFVVTSDRDINAAVAGDVLTVGLRSSDPDGDGAFTYQWHRDGVDIAGATGASYTITEADRGNGLYVAVRYTDGSGTDETVTASGIIVPVPANRAPVIDIASFVSIDENADGSADLVPVGYFFASDADAGDTLTYSIVSAVDQNGGDVTGFEFVGNGGLVAYVGTGFDAEAITSVVLTVSASDGQESVQTSVTISVTNIDEAIESAPPGLSIDENVDGSRTPVALFQVAMTDARDAVITYSIANAVDQNGGNVTGFDIDGSRGIISYAGTGLDAETITSVALTISARNGEDSVEGTYAIAVTNIDEGNARFVVTSDGDITAAAVGDVLTIRTISADPDGNDAFTYQWYRDGAEIADATEASYTIPEDYDGNSIYVVVRYTDGTGTDETVTASGIIVPVPADNDDDASEDPVNTTYTMTQAPTGASLTRDGVALSVGETFTHQDIQDGWVALTVNDENALSGLRLTTDDGTDANPAEISLDIEVREVADIAAPEAGNDLDYSENEGSLVIDTGDYGDQITAAQGSDFITGGLGDDTINLDPIEGRETGQDTVVYNFGSGSIFTATDGGDDITGFKRGEDIFLLKTESDNPELATLDGLLSYVSGPDKGSSHDDVMIVTPNYVFGPEDGGNNIVVTGITGITLHFEDAGTYGGGYLAQGHVSITFDEQLDWADFLSLIEIDNGDGTVDENFNYGRGLIRDLSALPNLMGEGSLAYEVEAPAQTPPQDVDVPLEDDIPATSFDVV